MGRGGEAAAATALTSTSPNTKLGFIQPLVAWSGH
jgi:hypothetical protein